MGRLGRAEGQQTLDRFIGWTAAQAAALGDPRDSAREGVSALAHVTTASSGQRNGGGERGRGRGAWAAGGAGEAGEAGAWGVAVKEELAAAHARAAEAEEQAARLAAELAAAKAEAEAAKAQAAELRASVEAAAAEKSAREQEVRAACRDLARAYGRAEREADVLRLGVVKMQCGNIVSRRIGTHLMEDWEPGLESLAREKEKEALVQLQGEITAERKRLRRCLPPPGVETSMSGDYIAPEEWSRRDEAMHGER